MHLRSCLSVLLLAALRPVAGAVSQARSDEQTCQKTTVAILYVLSFCIYIDMKSANECRGGGMAGISAAQALSNASVHDFMILEYRDRIGGRAWHEPFGKDKDGKPYTIEMGCNWVCRSTSDAHKPNWELTRAGARTG